MVDFDDTIGGEQMILAAEQAAEQAPFDGVLTWDEARVLQAAKVAQALRLPGGDPDMVLRCRDKYLTRTALAAAGVPQPRSVMVASLAEALSVAADIGYPVVLKPRAMAASLGVVRVDDPEQLSAYYGFARDTTVPGAWRYDLVLVEEYLSGEEISLDAAVHRGRALPLFLARKQVGYPPYFEEVGHLVKADDPLLQRSAAAADPAGHPRRAGLLRRHDPHRVQADPDRPQGGGGQRPARRRPDPLPRASAPPASNPARWPPRWPAESARRSSPASAGAGAVRFFYVDEPDTTIDRDPLRAASTARPGHRGVLAEPGQVLSPPPAGTAFGRAAYATAVAGDGGRVPGRAGRGRAGPGHSRPVRCRTARAAAQPGRSADLSCQCRVTIWCMPMCACARPVSSLGT